MSKIFKRVAAALMALAMIASMAACVKDKEGSNAQDVEAVTVGSHTLSAVELNYFFVDAVVDWYGANANYVYLLGFDPAKPLSQQLISSTTGETWADSFMSTALDNIRSTYALYDLAMANGFKLTPAENKLILGHIKELQETIDYYNKLYQSQGSSYPYSTVDEYLVMAYGEGANTESYQKYYEVCTIANLYYENYGNNLSYGDKILRDYEKDKYHTFNSYSYAVYYVALKDYDSKEAAQAVAQQLATGSYADQAAFNEAIKALEINTGKERPKLSTVNNNTLYSKLPTSYNQWLADDARVSGDLTMVPHLLVENDEKSLQGYYVVRYDSVNTNDYLMKNVRHVLIAFKGGVMNAVTGETTYSKEAKDAAKLKAEKLFVEFRTGAMTESMFASMANQFSDDGDGTTGGLYENIYRGQMVKAFEDWCFDPFRKTGDVEMVETEYGWHIMYFVSDSELTFRDQLVTNELRLEDLKNWYEGLLDSTKIELLDDSCVNKDLVLSK